jgi:hypothetical protein
LAPPSLTAGTRKLRLHVHAFTTPEILGDGFVIVDQQTGDSGSSQIPNDAMKVSERVHVVGRMPAYPRGDVLAMNSRVSQPLRNWNLSRWIARPFLALRRSFVGDARETRLKLSLMLKQFPAKIAINLADFQSPLKAFLLGEIEVFNAAASLIKVDLDDALSGNNVDVYRSIERDRRLFHGAKRWDSAELEILRGSARCSEREGRCSPVG